MNETHLYTKVLRAYKSGHDLGVRELAKKLFDDEVSPSTVSSFLKDEIQSGKSLEKMVDAIRNLLTVDNNLIFIQQHENFNAEEIRKLQKIKVRVQIAKEKSKMDQSVESLLEKIEHSKKETSNVTGHRAVGGAVAGGATALLLAGLLGGPIGLAAVGAVATAAIGGGVGNHLDEEEKKKHLADHKSLDQLKSNIELELNKYVLEMIELSEAYIKLIEQAEEIKRNKAATLSVLIDKTKVETDIGTQSKQEIRKECDKVIGQLKTTPEILGMSNTELIKDILELYFPSFKSQ